MKRKAFDDPYAELINEFNLRGIKYVVIGMSGINYYASVFDAVCLRKSQAETKTNFFSNDLK